jgi:hypothetical protein
VIASGLLEGEAEALVRKAVELAKTGDVVMLSFCSAEFCRASG